MWREAALGKDRHHNALLAGHPVRDPVTSALTKNARNRTKKSYQSRVGWPPWPSEGLMRFRLPHVFLGIAATACVLAAPAAHAFTVENKDAAGQYTMPKFDLEEQAKNFRKGEGSNAGKGDF